MRKQQRTKVVLLKFSGGESPLRVSKKKQSATTRCRELTEEKGGRATARRGKPVRPNLRNPQLNRPAGRTEILPPSGNKRKRTNVLAWGGDGRPGRRHICLGNNPGHVGRVTPPSNHRERRSKNVSYLCGKGDKLAADKKERANQSHRAATIGHFKKSGWF